MQQAYPRCIRRERQRGQVLPLTVAALLVIVGFTGLATDSARGVLNQNRAQAAADTAAMVAAFRMGGNPAAMTAADPAVIRAVQTATLSGVPTNLANSCPNPATPGRFDVTFYDLPHTTCPPPSYAFSVEIQVPAVDLAGPCLTNPLYCVEITVTSTQTNLMAGVLGRGTLTLRAIAVAYRRQSAAPAQLVW